MQLNTETARRQMVEQQIRTWQVLDSGTLTTLNQVHREQFVPPAFRDVAFADGPIPLSHGQIMLPPNVDGRILQALAPTSTDEVLDVGTGSGFLAACLGKMAARVRSVEIFLDLAEKARVNLHAAAVNNVVVDIVDALSLTDQDRYDAIAVTGSLPIEVDAFARALKLGGRMFMVVGQGTVMQAVKLTRVNTNEWQRQNLFETSIPPLLNARAPDRFRF